MLRILTPRSEQPQEVPSLSDLPFSRVFSYLGSSPDVALLGGPPVGGTGLVIHPPAVGGLSVGASGTGGRYWTGLATGSNYTFLAVVELSVSGGSTHTILDCDSSTAGLRTFQFRIDTVADGIQLTVFNTAGTAFSATGPTNVYSLGPVVVAGRVAGTQVTAWLRGRVDATATLTGTARSLEVSKQLWLANTGRTQNQPNLNRIFAAELFDGALPDAFLQSIKTPEDYYTALFAPRSIWVPVSSSASGTSYTISPSGGITFNGSGTEVHTKVIDVSGGVAFAGTGSMAFATTGTTYTISPSGGITFAGTGVQVRSKTIAPEGGFTFSGSGLDLRTKVIDISGGVTFGGTGSMTSNTIVVTGTVGERTKVGVGT